MTASATPEPFRAGELIYRTADHGRRVTRHKVARVTATMAMIEIREGVEERYRHDGRMVARGSGYGPSSTISRPTPHLERIWLQTRAIVEVTKLEDAARRYRQSLDIGGDTAQTKNAAEEVIARFSNWQAIRRHMENASEGQTR